MKNSFSKFFNTIIAFLSISILIGSSLTLNLSDIDKFQIENNLNTKIANIISNVYDENQFAVTSNILLIVANSSSNNSTNSSFGALELEGILPAVPQKTKDGVMTEDDYKIQIQDITVWLDYELDIINAQQNIKKFLFESIDWLENCENCLKFRSKAFPGANNQSGASTSNSFNAENVATEDDLRILEDNIAYLTEQIEKYENNNGADKNQWMIDFLNRALEEEKELNASLSEQIIENAKNVIRRDSSIIMTTTIGQKEIAETAMKENSRMVETFANNLEKVNDTQSKTNYFGWAVVFILITLYSLLIYFNKGPKTVYLKPKNNNKGDNSIDNNSSEQSSHPTATNLGANNNTLETELTKAYEDDSVIQSDLKSIKQSAVKMSVGQKHEASQILKDWLDNGKNEDSDNNDTNEESD